MEVSLLPSQTEWVLDTNRHPPVYTRPMVGSERWMHDCWSAFDGAGELCAGINFTSPLMVEELRDRTRRAVDKFRFVCPIVACVTEDDVSPRWVYNPSADREAWLNFAFVVEQRGPSLNSSEFVKDINLRPLPYVGADGTITLFRVYLLATSKEGNDGRKEYGLYFHGPHSMMDGGPIFHALNLMCEWVSGSGMDVTVVPLDEWKNLPVDVIVATGGVPKDWETSGAELLEDLTTQATKMFAPGHTLPPPSRPLDISERPIRHNITLSESETRAIVARAKKLGVSVSALFQAANGLAQLKMNPVPPGEDIEFPHTMITVSPERYLKPPVNPKTYFTSSLCVMPLHIPMARPLREGSEKATLIMMAKKVQEQLDKYSAHPCLPTTMSILAQLANPVTDQEASPETTLLPWQCDFQNLGTLESRIRTRQRYISIDKLCFGERLITTTIVQMWTLHKKHHFQVEGAAAWGDEFLKTLLEETIRIGLLVLDDAKL
ncbi:hypothetical protein JVU11DRAFT_9629 [Chiua virens]|nr:hypothetical protein JVU11DRAFT_9629 [Chiua virens]